LTPSLIFASINLVSGHPLILECHIGLHLCWEYLIVWNSHSSWIWEISSLRGLCFYVLCLISNSSKLALDQLNTISYYYLLDLEKQIKSMVPIYTTHCLFPKSFSIYSDFLYGNYYLTLISSSSHSFQIHYQCFSQLLPFLKTLICLKTNPDFSIMIDYFLDSFWSKCLYSFPFLSKSLMFLKTFIEFFQTLSPNYFVLF
jgi:hypothetical protein